MPAPLIETVTDLALAVCNHPGGARALVPVVETFLARTPALSFDMWLTRHGVGIADVRLPRLRARLRDESIADEEYDRLDLRDYQFVLTATSISGNLESAVVRRSRDQGVPVLSILDQASEYDRRFQGVGGELAAVPDVVFVPNETARHDLLGRGVSSQRVVVSGNPALDHLPQARMRFSDHTRQQVLGELAVGDSPGFILFVSEPISTDHADGTRYSEWSALQLTLATVRAMSAARRPAVVVKTHPREAPTKFDRVITDCGDVQVRTAPLFIDRHDLVMASNLVIGIESTLLTEAAVLGVPCVSLPPGRHTVEGIVAIPDAAAFCDVLQQPWRTPSRPPGRRPIASDIIVDAVAAYTGGRSINALPASDGR